MGKHLPERLLMLVKSSCRTNYGRVSNSADHFISEPTGGGCTGNITSRVNGNCSHSIVGPAGGGDRKIQSAYDNSGYSIFDHRQAHFVVQ